LILYDPALEMNFQDYGIMLPIVPDRGKQVLDFLGKNYHPLARGATMPYPGPVFSIDDALAFLNYGTGALITREDVERIHSGEFTASLYEKESDLEAALLATYELIDAQGRPHRYEPERAVRPLAGLFRVILAQVGGTYLGGGMHHARYDSGSGFCLINDVTAAAFKTLSRHKPVRMIWIIDLDAHKGDGTAELVRFARERGELRVPGEKSAPACNKPCILTLSIHMAKGWPLDEESLLTAEAGRAPLLPSDVDIGIGTGEEGDYTPRLAEGIRELERLSGETAAPRPDFVLVVDGADVYEHDGLPSSSPLRLTLEQCLERDTWVYRYLKDRGIPSAWIQAGGYGSRAWEPPAYFLQRGISKP